MAVYELGRRTHVRGLLMPRNKPTQPSLIDCFGMCLRPLVFYQETKTEREGGTGGRAAGRTRREAGKATAGSIPHAAGS